MPANKYALIRYRVIDNCLTNKYRPFPSKEDLRAACEDALYGSSNARVSISTIEKDLFAMRNDTVLGYEAPIAYDKGEKGYYYEEAEYTIKKIPLGEEDMDALQFAAMTLYQFKDIPIFKAYEQAIEKVRENVALSDSDRDGSFRNHMLFEQAEGYSGNSHLVPLLKCIQEKKLVELEYGSFQSPKAKKYLLAPYLLKEHNKGWYVVGLDVEADKVKTFGLERIKEITPREELFQVENFDAETYFEHSVGITHFDTEPRKVRLSIQKPQSSYMLANPIHHSQKRVGGNTHSDVVEMNVIISHELVNTILSWSPHVRVLAPDELKNVLVERLQKALQHQDSETFLAT